MVYPALRSKQQLEAPLGKPGCCPGGSESPGVQGEGQKFGLATRQAEDCSHAVIDEVVLAPQPVELEAEFTRSATCSSSGPSRARPIGILPTAGDLPLPPK